MASPSLCVLRFSSRLLSFFSHPPRHVFCVVDLGWLDKFDPYPFRFALP